MRSDGGVAPALTISEMKLAVIPMTAIMETIWRARVALKVAPRTPWSGPMLKTVVNVVQWCVLDEESDGAK